MAYGELSNGSVWYDERGQREPLVLLHGGAVDARFLSPDGESHFPADDPVPTVAPIRRAGSRGVGSSAG